MSQELWQQALQDAVISADQLAEHFDIDPRPLMAVAAKYPMRITPYYLGLIEKVGDQIWKQAVPDLHELADDGLSDPLAEEEFYFLCFRDLCQLLPFLHPQTEGWLC